MAAITIPGENLIASKQANEEILNIDRVVLANIPGLNPDDPVDRNQQLPPEDQIVFNEQVSQTGYINPNLVVYSLMMGTGGESFEFNWLGLYASVEDVVVLISYAPTQNKDPSVAMTRNFMMEFSGASETTDINIDAESWQVDFSARMDGTDDRARQTNEDVFGRQLFYGDTCKVVEDGGGYYQVLPGEKAYVAGIQFGFAGKRVLIEDLPTFVWLDVSQQGDSMSDVVPVVVVVLSDQDLSDYVSNDGIIHFLEKIAIVSDNFTEQDLRYSVSEPVVIPARNEAQIDTITNIERLNLNGYTHLKTSGYETIGDGGHASFYKVSSDTGSQTCRRDIAGNWWEQIDNNSVSVKKFGAKGDGVSNDKDAIIDALKINSVTRLADDHKIIPPLIYNDNPVVIDGTNGKLISTPDTSSVSFARSENINIKNLQIERRRCSMKKWFNPMTDNSF